MVTGSAGSARGGLQHLSVWLHMAPDDEIQLANVVDAVSVWCGSPRFVPHVTLVGGFDAVAVDAAARAEELAATLEPMDVVLTTLRCEPVFHRSLYAEVDQHDALQSAFDRAVSMWSLTDQRPYRPHVSLAYLDLPLAEKEAAGAAVQLALPAKLRLDRLALWTTPMPTVAEWHPVAEWLL